MYSQFTRFLAPLVVATIVLEIGGQFLNGGMARVPRATETLAAYGLALGLMTILSGPLYQTRQLALAMIDNRRQLRTATRSVVGAGIVLTLAMAALGLEGFGRWLVEDVHGISPSLADQAQTALLLMSPLALINSLVRYYSGLLARFRRTEIISLSSTGGIIVRVASVFLLLNRNFVQEEPILLPIVVSLLGALIEWAIVMWGHLRYARPALPASGDPLTLAEIVRFLWPLAIIMTFQGLSRPLINLVVSRGSDATEALAVLTVVYALGHIHYGWVNELRSLAPAFREEDNSLPGIRRFSVGCCAISFTIALILFWTPIRSYLLLDLIGIEPVLADRCIDSLLIFSFFPFAVTLRSYYHGVGVLRRMTDAMAASAPSRITAIGIALFIFSFTGVAGATRGIGSLFCGFAAEALVVSWGIRRRTRTQSDGDVHI